MKTKIGCKRSQWWCVLFVGVFLCTTVAGCSSRRPDFEQLKADLQKRLQDHRGDMTVGNADIYTIVSLAIVNQNFDDDKKGTLEFHGEVECLNGFYMAEDGRYSVSKPTWPAKRHVAKGNRIGFAGTAVYEKGATGWKAADISTTMKQRYAPSF